MPPPPDGLSTAMKLRFMGAEIDVSDEQVRIMLGEYFRGLPSLAGRALVSLRRGESLHLVGAGAWQPSAPCLVGKAA
jgi:hypothetical protein